MEIKVGLIEKQIPSFSSLCKLGLNNECRLAYRFGKLGQEFSSTEYLEDTDALQLYLRHQGCKYYTAYSSDGDDVFAVVCLDEDARFAAIYWSEFAGDDDMIQLVIDELKKIYR